MDIAKYNKLKKEKMNTENQRIFVELDYLIQMNKVNNDFFSQDFDNVVNYLNQVKNINKNIIFKCEKMLETAGKEAKKLECICVAHAHIDINWLWGYNETTAITLATLDTMVQLLEKYKNFTFSQSSALVYQIAKKYRPKLFDKIKKYIKNGRFEVIASTFVENDKNLPNGNSLIKQYKYTKKYLSDLLKIKQEDLCIDFEPDTFGHCLYLPEILSECGIKYYYQCRGNNLSPFYKWCAPSGKNVLVYREPHWYNGTINNEDFDYIPDFCNRYNVKKVLKVYGVGDHGGGASIRDIEKILEISKYPIMATIKFGTYHEFFDYLSTLNNIPVEIGEQSSIFSGCYSSQSDIKYQNAITENSLYNQELFCSLDSTKRNYNNSAALECLLTNEFHDVITGSGVEDTLHYAMGLYQQAQAEFGAFTAESIKNFTDTINTFSIYKNITSSKQNISFGAGVGFGAKEVNYSNYIAYGNERAYVIFNQLNIHRQINIKIPVWDYFGDINALKVFDNQGNLIPFALRNALPNFYWYHNFNEFEINIDLQPFSYKTIIIREEENNLPKQISYPPLFQRTEEEKKNFVLENKYIRVIFDVSSFEIISFYDKIKNEEKLSAAAHFVLYTEDTTEQMTAWYVGRYKERKNLHTNVKLIPSSIVENNVSNQLGFEISFNQSKLQVFICLEKEAKGINIFVNADFFEKGNSILGIPNLNFVVPIKKEFSEILCDVPLGIIKRKTQNKDVPCSSLISANGVTLLTNGKHGFRGYNGEISVCLIRASCDPHPLPEYKNHIFNFGLYLCDENAINLLHLSENFRLPPMCVSVSPHVGKRNVCGKLLDISENIICVSINENKVILFNPMGKEVTAYINKKEIKIEKYSLKEESII